MMDGRRRPPALVLGSGAMACAAAIVLARRGTRVTLCSRPRAEDPAPRVDAVPLQILASLVELGLHPAALEVSARHDVMLRAWEGVVPSAVATAPKAHIDRQILDRALTELASRTPDVTLVPEPSPESFELVFDATGRRARTAVRVHRAAPEWVARLWCFEGRFTEAQAAFRIAALPFGYAYRLGTARQLSLGLVAPTDEAAPFGKDWREALTRWRAAWLMDGLPRDLYGVRGRGGACSVQWAEPGRAQLLGDAGFAPDILAAQGLSRGLSSNFTVGQGESSAGAETRFHLTALRRGIALCRWHESITWSRYDRTLVTLGNVAPVAA
jgi:hypothetical protein